MNALGSLVVAAVPVLAVILLFAIVERVRRARRDAVEHQVAVTDAVHSELGALVAPTVTRGRSGAWQVQIAVPFEHPVVVERVVAICHATLAGRDPARADRIRIVLVPQPRLRRYMPAATNTPKMGVQKERAASP